MLCRLVRNAVPILLALVVVLAVAGIATACPTCKDGLAANDPHQANIVRGYFYSILLMMGMPFALITCFSLYMYREVRKARARDAARCSVEAKVAEDESPSSSTPATSSD